MGVGYDSNYHVNTGHRDMLTVIESSSIEASQFILYLTCVHIIALVKSKGT